MDKIGLGKVQCDGNGRNLRCLALVGLIVMASCLVHAKDGAAIPSEMLIRSNNWTMTVSTKYSYVGAGGISFQSLKGNSDAQFLDADATLNIPLNDHWFIPVGFSSQNLFLGTVADAPIPNRINTLSFNAGIGYNLNDRWSFVGSIGPELYRLDCIDGDDVGISGVLAATWKWKPNLTITLGVGFDPANEVPVLPIPGLRWDIRTNLTLNLALPEPAVIYRINNRLGVFLGASGSFAVFRADENLGDKIGQPTFDNALGTYREFRVGAGLGYRISRGLTVGINSGYSIGREIDYTKIKQTVSFANRHYLQIAVKWRF